jgi:hypothetical protein
MNEVFKLLIITLEILRQFHRSNLQATRDDYVQD